jgi:two-component system CheB/CheR fusion protein
MPADSGFAFVVVQHLDPRHPTLLPELLGKVTTMPVEQVRDETPTLPNHVYVIPPNTLLTVESGVLRVRPPEAVGLRMPIDRLFYSIAEDCGDNAVCILLSGGGSDGTLGLRSVKEHGGLAMAQTPETAQHDSILRSAINTGMVDYILAPEAMPQKLMDYAAYMRAIRARKQSLLSAEAQDSLARICGLLRRKTGHDFSRYKVATLVRRIQRRMQVLQVPHVAGYLDALREQPKEVEALFRDLLIGVTHFFRDSEAFQALEREVIPKLVAHAGQEGTVRVWIPGCATGEEAYSVAILLREEIQRTDLRLRVQIFAGDIDDRALEAARQGRYPEGVAEHISPDRLERFFTRQGPSYQVNKDVREMCIFSTHNLIRDPPFSRLDLLVCRNLLIYLEGELQRHVANVFHYALRTGGYLFLGPSESLSGPADQFRTIDKKHRIFQRNETVARTPLALPLPDSHPRSKAAATLSLTRAPGRGQSEVVAVLERILLEQYAPAWVVVNGAGQTVYFSPRTGRFLEPAAGVPSMDILDMARKSLRLDLRTAMHKAVKTGEPVVHEDVAVETDGLVQRINLIVRPLFEAGAEPGLFMIVFQELGPPLDHQTAAVKDPGAATNDQIVQQLESELRLTKEHLQATVEEVETSNEELKSSNEELLSTNEELHSVNEELQTSKEELQSVNEELETINAELNKKVEALDRANSDLQNLLQSTQIPTVFVDNDLRIKRFTEAATSVYRLIESDVGRSLNDITPRFEGDVLADMKQVLRTLVPRDRQVRVTDGTTATYLMRILPYRRLDNMIDGLVVTFVDLTQHEEAEQHRARLAAIVESSHDAIVGRTLDGIITTWNQAAARTFGYSENDALGRPVSLFVPGDQVEAVEQAHARLHKGETVPPFHAVATTRDGRRLDVSLAISLVHDGAGAIVGSSAIIRDITDLKRAERALREEARHKDEFLAVLSHELRNPLAPMRSCLDLLRQPESDAESAARCIDIMDRQLHHLTALVNQLMDASRIASGKIQLEFAREDLVGVVRSAIEDQRRVVEKAGLELRLAIPTRPLPVDGDALRLSQVVANLVNNAAKFTLPGGRITVEAFSEDGRAVVRVSDTGIGMDEEVVKRVFEPFSQGDGVVGRRTGGLGLGLSLVHALVAAHGGSVQARSAGRDQGSTFTVELPLKAELAGTRSVPIGRVVDGPPRRILVIEDNIDAAEGMRMVLEQSGHEVAVAHDGARGLEIVRSMRPEVVVCDLGLPGMSGYAVAAAVKADPHLAGVRMIALTGYDQPRDQARAREAGFERHIAKPVDLPTIREVIASLG